MIGKCELCGQPSIGVFNRQWHDGTVDEGIEYCEEHGKDDPDGMFLVYQVYNSDKM